MANPAPSSRVLRHAAIFLLVAGITFVIVQAGQDRIDDTPEGYNASDAPRTAVVVLDGAEWKIIDRLRKDGRLPNIADMMEGGQYTYLITPRAFSPITWTKIGTGRRAEDLNVDGWNIELQDGDRRMVQSSDVEHKRFWDYLNLAGIPTGITNYFLTWPVDDIRGFMIAVAAAQSERGLASPEDILPEEVLRSADEWRIANAVLDRKQDYRFLTFGFKGLDAKQHSLWKFLVPDQFGLEDSPEYDAYREEVYAEYENVDAFLGRFDERRNVIFVSDSGFKAKTVVQAKTLEDWRAGNISGEVVHPSYEGNLDPLLKALGYSNYETRERLGEEVRVYDYEHSSLKWCSIDYPYTDQLNTTTYIFRFCILDDTLNVSATIDRLEQVRYRNGDHFFENLHYDPETNSIRGRWRLFADGVAEETVREQFSHQPTFHGKLYEVDKALGLRLPNGTGFDLWIGPEKTGDHPPNTHGVFIAAGPAFRDAGEIPFGTVRAIDIAPTILYMYDLPIPLQMDGRAVTELFTDAFNAQRTIRYTNMSTLRNDTGYLAAVNQTRSRALKERLRGLGYLD